MTPPLGVQYLLPVLIGLVRLVISAYSFLSGFRGPLVGCRSPALRKSAQSPLNRVTSLFLMCATSKPLQTTIRHQVKKLTKFRVTLLFVRVTKWPKTRLKLPKIVLNPPKRQLRLPNPCQKLPKKIQKLAKKIQVLPKQCCSLAKPEMMLPKKQLNPPKRRLKLPNPCQKLPKKLPNLTRSKKRLDKLPAEWQNQLLHLQPKTKSPNIQFKVKKLPKTKSMKSQRATQHPKFLPRPEVMKRQLTKPEMQQKKPTKLQSQWKSKKL